MQDIQVSGRLIRPLSGRIQDWEREGKLDDDQLAQSLSSEARAWVDGAVAEPDWATCRDAEGLVAVAAEMLGGEAGLVDWADELVADLLLDPALQSLVGAGRRLADGPGFVASQASEALLRRVAWRYEGSARSFQVRLAGLEEASAALKALLGAVLARLAASADARALDVRVDGVDTGELVVFGELEVQDGHGENAESRLHRAALIP